MSSIEAARALMAETRASGALLRWEPFPIDGPWERPARWRVSGDVWVALVLEAQGFAALMPPLAENIPPRLFGYPIEVDAGSPPGFMTLEPIEAEGRAS